MSVNRGSSEIMAAVPNVVHLILELFKSDAKWHAKKVVDLLHCDHADIEAVQNKLKVVTSYSDLVRESSSRMLGNKRFMREEMRIKERRHGGESNMYQKKMVDVLQRQIKIYPTEEKIQLRTAEKKRSRYFL